MSMKCFLLKLSFLNSSWDQIFFHDNSFTNIYASIYDWIFSACKDIQTEWAGCSTQFTPKTTSCIISMLYAIWYVNILDLLIHVWHLVHVSIYPRIYRIFSEYFKYSGREISCEDKYEISLKICYVSLSLFLSTCKYYFQNYREPHKRILRTPFSSIIIKRSFHM